MPKKTRKARRAPAPKVEVSEVQETLPGGMPWSIQERLRVRCPCCGSLPEEERIKLGPYELEVQLQRFGGSFKSPTGRMKSRRGYMDYEPQPQMLEEWRGILREKLQAALDLLGE